MSKLNCCFAVACSEDREFLVGSAFGECWVFNSKTRQRAFLGDIGNEKSSLRVRTVLSNQFAFFGLKKGTKDALKAWYVDERLPGMSIEVPFQQNSRFKGLGAAVCVAHRTLECDEPGEEWVFRLACGRGIGKAHVWTLHLRLKFPAESQGDANGASIECREFYEGTLNAKSSTIYSMGLSNDGLHLLTVSSEGQTQLWPLAQVQQSHLTKDNTQVIVPLSLEPWQSISCRSEQEWTTKSLLWFDAKTHDCQSLDRTNLEVMTRILGTEEKSILLLDEFKASSTIDSSTVELSVHKWIEIASQNPNSVPVSFRGLPWESVFPLRLLDPTAYEGEVDQFGRPHGYGVKLVDRWLYEGRWSNGKQHGLGCLVDPNTRDIVYCGGWKHGFKHGFGEQVKRTGGTVVAERYQGWWRRGKRHGIGILRTSKGTTYTGFFRDGYQHGLSWCCWPPMCEDLPFAVSLGAMKHLGEIRCIVQFKHGKFFNEFNFHRADRCAISPDEALLFNIPSSRFSPRADGKWMGPECWSCMEPMSSLERKTAIRCLNSHCGLCVHPRCIGKRAASYPNFQTARNDYCRDLEGKGYRLPSSEDTLSSASVWCCPSNRCKLIAQQLMRDPTTIDLKTTTCETNVTSSTASTPLSEVARFRVEQSETFEQVVEKAKHNSSQDAIRDHSLYLQYIDVFGEGHGLTNDEDLSEALQDAPEGIVVTVSIVPSCGIDM